MFRNLRKVRSSIRLWSLKVVMAKSSFGQSFFVTNMKSRMLCNDSKLLQLLITAAQVGLVRTLRSILQ